MPAWPDPRTRSTTILHSPPLGPLKILVVASSTLDSGVTTGTAQIRSSRSSNRENACWGHMVQGLASIARTHSKNCQDADGHLTDTTSHAREHSYSSFHGGSTRFCINPRLPLPPSAGTRRHARARRTKLA
jgi:hypothetical protein